MLMLMQECRTALPDTAMLKQNRVRPYKLLYTIETCPFQTVLSVVWLVIEKTTLEDAAMTFECFGEYEIRNPVATTLSEEKTLLLNPGMILYSEYGNDLD